ncbi:MAG: flagellar hook-associated protein 1 [Verrucomicrobiota bacterium]|jgi:flagellar hook-associated protein 1 FlgK
MSLTNSLWIGESSLLTRQVQLRTVGNNVANSDRTGYHRQTATLDENIPLNTSKLQLGSGVHVQNVVRSFDVALEGNLRTSIMEGGYQEQYERYLGMTEAAVSSDGASPLTGAISELAASLQSLSNNPESEVHRSTFLAGAERVASAFNLQHSLLLDVRDGIATSASAGALPDQVVEANTLASRIADLNDRITRLELGFWQNNNQLANELRDDRDRAVSDLAKLINITVTEQQDRSYTVQINGRDFVTGATVADNLQADVTGNVAALQWASDSADVGQDLGEMSGLVDAYNYIQGKITETDAFAAEFATILNTQHAAGFDKNGASGLPIFDTTVPGEMKVLISDGSLVAAADNSSNAGDGGNALAMWKALQTPSAALGNDAPVDRADRIVDNIAVDRARAQANLDTATSTQKMFQSIIDERSGVNVEQEMTNMLEYQRAFQSSAKFVSIVDQMMQTVIGMI